MVDKMKAVMIGHAVADALGVPVEFASRAKLDADPVVDMRGFGTYPYPAGCWSDDTSMSLAALDSLASGKLDWDEIMKNFGKWYYHDEYTPTGELFDIGNTCSMAITNYFRCGKTHRNCGLKEASSNGNGSLMRIHPFALYLFFKGNLRISTIHKSSALTHAHKRSQMACGIYSFVLWSLLNDPRKESVIEGLERAKKYYTTDAESQSFSNLFLLGSSVDVCNKTDRAEIKSGGYVVHTLEATIWCLLTTDSYRECVLKAVNLGDDTDTIAAIAGGLAGALYGYDAIPKEWLATIYKRDYIENMCRKACEAWQKSE